MYVMKLHFTCPKEKVTFASDKYSLYKGHRVVVDEAGVRELLGTVSLNSACPVCGERHEYEVKEVVCPLSGEENER